MAISMPNLQFLKLGGSLITDKDQPHTLRPAVLARLAGEIAQSLQRTPGLRLLIGHGSGSFGHVPAHRYGTRRGVATPEQWAGFVEVWQEAAALNHLVVAALQQAGLPALAFPPSAAATAGAGRVRRWDLRPVRHALQAGLLPVVYGDVVFDTRWGGTILSTEDLFAYLAPRLAPQRILLAGLEAGVWADFPACTHLLETILPQDFPALQAALGGSASVDVTGGMSSKVQESLALLEQVPGLEVLIFSGTVPGNLTAVLQGERHGTCIRDKRR